MAQREERVKKEEKEKKEMLGAWLEQVPSRFRVTLVFQFRV